ncbi:MAG: Fur family transcriptional regulator [Oligosphaeraceae bacterium]
MTTPERVQAYEELRRVCAEQGWKCTPQRLAVYAHLRGNLTHPSVNAVWEAVREEIPSITRESVFRILTELSGIGLIARLDKIVDARFDGRADDHGHLVCERCGCVMDFELPSGLPLPESLHGFRARHTELRISGLCASCAAALSAEEERK